MTQAVVDSTLTRALQTMFIISKKIEDEYWYFVDQQYVDYKNIQYDIYTLYNTIKSQEAFVAFPTLDITFTSLVGVLINKISQFDIMGAFGNVANPNAQIPGQTIVTIPVYATLNSDKIPFATSSGTPVLTINWQTDIVPGFGGTYASRYGNNPQLALYNTDGTLFTGDEQTPPILNYTANDPSQPLLTVTYDYPVATAGYVQITGQVAGSGSASGGTGASVTTMTFNQGILISDGMGGYYLPLNLAGRTYLSTTVNGVGTSVTPDFTTTPARLYGFANNDTQTIIVTVL